MNNSRALTFLVSGGSIFWILASLAPELAIFGALLLESRPELASEQYFSEWRRAPKISLAPCFHVCENQRENCDYFYKFIFRVSCTVTAARGNDRAGADVQ